MDAAREGPAGEASLEAVLGKTQPYGILGGTMETSASFEARSAPSPYPTEGGSLKLETTAWASLSAILMTGDWSGLSPSFWINHLQCGPNSMREISRTATVAKPPVMAPARRRQ